MERILNTIHIETVAKSTVKKFRALSKIIKELPQQQQKSESMLALNPSLVSLKATTIILDACTRCNSTHETLQRALNFKTAIVLYVQSEKYPQDRRISDIEWTACEQVVLILQPLAEVTRFLSSSRTRISISQASVSYNAILSKLKDKNEISDYRNMQPASRAIIDKLEEYRTKVMSKAIYRLATILNPRLPNARRAS